MRIKALLMTIICIYTLACSAMEYNSKERQKILEHASLLIQKGNFDNAYDLLISGAEDNDYEMQNAIALIVSNGYGPVEDSIRNEVALKWIVSSAQGGFKDSINWLADSYQYGWFGLNEDINAADCWRSKTKVGESNINVCPVPK